jgi:hypothetical protein
MTGSYCASCHWSTWLVILPGPNGLCLWELCTNGCESRRVAATSQIADTGWNQEAKVCATTAHTRSRRATTAAEEGRNEAMVYEVTCITIYEEDTDSADEAKAIIERNCPDQYFYMIAKKKQEPRP